MGFDPFARQGVNYLLDCKSEHHLAHLVDLESTGSDDRICAQTALSNTLLSPPLPLQTPISGTATSAAMISQHYYRL